MSSTMSLAEVRSALGRLVHALDPDVLDPADATRMVGELSAIKNLAATGERLCARRVAATGAWRGSGARSEADWFARITGVSYGEAQSSLETAARLEALPEVEVEARTGSMHEDRIRMIADAASADPGAAAALLDAARTESFRGLKQACDRVRAAATDDAERHRLIHQNRFLRSWQDRNGAGRLEASGPPQVIARFLAALEPHRDAAFKEARAQGRREPGAAYAFDALERFLGSGGGEDGSSTGTTTRRKRKPEAEVIVIIDAAALARGGTESGETCEIAGLGPVPVATAREVLGDALLSVIVKRGCDVATVVHCGRTINAPLRTALLANGWQCATPGCSNIRRLQVDHQEALSLRGRTELRNLAPLCTPCHTAKTERDMAELRRRRSARRE